MDEWILVYGTYETTQSKSRLHEVGGVAAWNGLIRDGVRIIGKNLRFQAAITTFGCRSIGFRQHCRRLWKTFTARVPAIPLFCERLPGRSAHSYLRSLARETNL